jgi:hypothetical protein
MQLEPAASSPRLASDTHDRSEWRRTFEREGYVLFPGLVDEAVVARLHREILGEFERARVSEGLFAGGGSVSGHLNCFPGSASRAIGDVLAQAGILDFARSLSPEPLRLPNVGCNLNLPGSSSQNEHIDGYFSAPFLIVNVATVDTDLTNGAMEVLCRTHRRNYKYWQLAWERPERKRLCLKRGDALLRVSTLWHRGMPNRSAAARPMLAFTWENGGSTSTDPYAAHGGRIVFLPNRYATDFRGRLRERVFVAAPRASMALRVVQSLFER